MKAVRIVVVTSLVAMGAALFFGGVLWLIGTLPIVFFAGAATLYIVLSATSRRGGRRRS